MRPKALFSVNAAPFDAAAEGLSGDPRAPFLDFYTSSALLPLSAPGKASRTQESRHAATARADAQAAVESAPRRRRAAGLRAVAVCFVAARHVPPFPCGSRTSDRPGEGFVLGFGAGEDARGAQDRAEQRPFGLDRPQPHPPPQAAREVAAHPVEEHAADLPELAPRIESAAAVDGRQS